VRGQADLGSDGKTAQLDLKLQAGGGRIEAKATGKLEKTPIWDLQLTVDKVDPAAVTALAPPGEVTARVSLHGKGTPQFDQHGVRGDLRGNVHVGPARLDRVGPLVVDLEARLDGRYALVKAFSATALGLSISAHGAAARDALSLDLDVNAPDLAHVGRAVGALTRKPSLPMAGAMHLTARVTGSPQAPDAQIHLRAPKFRWGPTVAAEGLSVEGVLQGDLTKPDGSLRVTAQRVAVGSINVGAPRIDIGLEWPVAHLRIDAGVQDGALALAGDAQIDEDKDGLVLSNFIVAYPGNQLHLARDTNVHFRDEVVIEPLELTGDHGSLRLSAQIRPKTKQREATIEAAVVVTRFELDRLPRFALPGDLGLHGLLDANAVVSGPQAAPDFDLRADVRGAGARPAGDLAIDAHTHAHLHAGRLKADGWIAAKDLMRFSFDGELPAVSLAQQPPNAPIRLEARLEQVDIEKVANVAKLTAVQKARVHGLVDLRLSASGTLAQPRATLALAAHDVGTQTIKQVDGRAGVLLDRGSVVLDGNISLQGAQALGLTVQAPFDLLRALRDPAYLSGALRRPVKAELVVTQFALDRAVQTGLLPEGSAGTVNLSLRLAGTPSDPTLDLNASGEEVSVGRLRGLAFQAELGIADQVKIAAGAQAHGDVVARLDATAKLSGGEIVELVQRRAEPDAISPLLNRAVALTLDIPGLPIARASQLAGRQKSVAEGKVVGHVALAGTPARPRLTGRLTVHDLASGTSKLGAADIYLEADASGALLHLGIDPPGGGKFLGHATLQADLGARTLLSRGAASILDGQLSGQVQANQLDLAFLSGLAPTVRRTGGTLDGNVEVSGLLGKPIAKGEAHMRRGLFDVVGQGVYEDVGLDATFSPKEVVIDRITGSTGTGTFSTILVASRKPQPDGNDKFEFTGEVHLGDEESVRDRKRPDGKPLRAGPIPVRQAGEQRMDVSGELDLFGDYTDSLLTVNAKVPDARVQIRALPDKSLPKLKENPDVMLVHPGEKPHPPGREPGEVEAEHKAMAQATFRMHAHLNINHLYVKAEDFEFPVQSDINFDYDARRPDEPTADGTVHVPQGSFSALGRRFIIEDAKIIETGGEIDNPELEIKARYDNPKATVTINISGTAKEPILDMTSNPPMDQDAIAFFLATGRINGRATQQGGGVDLSGAATSVLGSVLFGQLRKELASVLPVDVLTIETGASGVSMASVGKYIGDRVYIGYRQQFTPVQYQNSSEGRIEYEISKSITAEATIGDRTKDISVLWTKDF
jgi:translocation and assembly module TamB